MSLPVREWIERLQGGRLGPLVQFVKFGLVGVSNTLLSYALEMLGYYVVLGSVGWSESVRAIVISAVSFFISVTHSYYWNNRFVFGSGEKKTLGQHLRSYLKTVLCYGLTGLLLSPAIKVWLLGYGVPFWMGTLLALIVTIPLNFLLNKWWAFKPDGAQRHEGAD